MRRAINIPQLQLRHLAVQHPRVERTGGLFIEIAGMILTATHLFIILLYSMAPLVHHAPASATFAARLFCCLFCCLFCFPFYYNLRNARLLYGKNR